MEDVRRGTGEPRNIQIPGCLVPNNVISHRVAVAGWGSKHGACQLKRLTIDVTDQQLQSLKALAATQGKTIGQYALERLFPGGKNADEAWQELKILLGARINEGQAGEMSAKGVREVLVEELAEGSRAGSA